MATYSDFTIRRGDLLPELQATLTNDAGDPIDLTTATGVRFHMRAVGGRVAVVDEAATVLTPAAGTVSYSWDTGDTATAGTFHAEFQVTYGDGRTQSFPTPGYLIVSITDELA